MKNNRIEWKKPIIIVTTFAEISNNIKAMANSLGPCGTPGGCSCSASCNPIALHWSCQDFFIIAG